jgi:hypothetical protein
MKKYIFLFVVFFHQHTFAWGPTGHRVVGEIAMDYLEIPALKKIAKLLQGQSFAKISTWPDEIKSDPKNYQYTFNWHYTDWPNGMHDHDETKSSGILLEAIEKQMLTLKDSTASDEKKVFALKFLIHLVGDLHMPLHVGSGLDRGGNDCKVYFQNRLTNLHSVWDEEMINSTHLSFTEMVKFIRQGRNPQDLKDWRNGSPIDWARESKTIRSSLYPLVDLTVTEGALQPYCKTGSEIPAADIPKLSYEYSYKFMPVVETRLLQAGIRLAILLNNSLKD